MVRVIGSKFISKICLRTFRRGVRIKGGDLLKIISFFVKLCYDMDDFEKMRKKIRTEEVEYREGIVEIKVTFLDEKSSK